MRGENAFEMADEVILTPLVEVTLDWEACLKRLFCLFVWVYLDIPHRIYREDRVMDEETMNRFEIVETCR